MALITSDCGAMQLPGHENGPDHLGLCALQAELRARLSKQLHTEVEKWWTPNPPLPPPTPPTAADEEVL